MHKIIFFAILLPLFMVQTSTQRLIPLPLCSSYRSAIAGVEEKPPLWLRWRVPLYRATQAKYHAWIMRRFHRRFWGIVSESNPNPV